MLEELGPEVILFLITKPFTSNNNNDDEASNSNLLASAGYKPYISTWPPEVHHREKRGDVLESVEAKGTPSIRNIWQEEKPYTQTFPDSPQAILEIELVSLVVAPGWEKHGFASQLLKAITDDICKEANSNSNSPPRVRLWARTVKEINEQFWIRRGFKTVGSRSFEPGFQRSVDGFHILDMVREFDVEDGG